VIFSSFFLIVGDGWLFSVLLVCVIFLYGEKAR
ncbi:MAG: hypothetical protein ACI8RD_009356, partial [Bacillariaceae sp.]